MRSGCPLACSVPAVRGIYRPGIDRAGLADAASEQSIDLASRRVELRRLQSQLSKQLLPQLSVSGDIGEFDIFISAHDIG